MRISILIAASVVFGALPLPIHAQKTTDVPPSSHDDIYFANEIGAISYGFKLMYNKGGAFIAESSCSQVLDSALANRNTLPRIVHRLSYKSSRSPVVVSNQSDAYESSPTDRNQGNEKVLKDDRAWITCNELSISNNILTFDLTAAYTVEYGEDKVEHGLVRVKHVFVKQSRGWKYADSKIVSQY